MKDSPVTNTEKKVDSEFRKIFSCDHVLVRVPLPNKYMRYDKAHKFLNKENKLVFIPSNFVRGFLFPGTKMIMYIHYYISEDYLGGIIVAQIELQKKIYPDNRVQYILNVRPQSNVGPKYELKIIANKPNRNDDLGYLICIEGKAIGKIACREIV